MKLFVDREQQSSTLLSQNLAIPHIIIEGQHKLDILIARCRRGIEFSKAEPNVTAVFIIVGTKDERNFHLHCLAAIAQIVQDPGFEKKWMDAKNKEALRDIVLLGSRMCPSRFWGSESAAEWKDLSIWDISIQIPNEWEFRKEPDGTWWWDAFCDGMLRCQNWLPHTGKRPPIASMVAAVPRRISYAIGADWEMPRAAEDPMAWRKLRGQDVYCWEAK